MVFRLGPYLFSKSCLIWLWHRLLGHPSFWLLKNVFPSLFENINCLDFHWEVCVLAKYHLYSFPVKNPKRLSPFCLMHSDVWGSSHVTNNLDFWWFVTFIDDCTCSTWVYLLKSKSEVSTIFPIFHKFMSTQLGVKIYILKSDNREKYFNNDLIALPHCLCEQPLTFLSFVLGCLSAAEEHNVNGFTKCWTRCHSTRGSNSFSMISNFYAQSVSISFISSSLLDFRLDILVNWVYSVKFVLTRVLDLLCSLPHLWFEWICCCRGEIIGEMRYQWVICSNVDDVGWADFYLLFLEQ